MSLYDDTMNRLKAVLDRVRGETTVRAGLEAAGAAKDEEIKNLRERLEAEQKQPGPWTETDIQNVIDQLKAIEDALPTSQVADAVVENTPAATEASGNAG